MLFNYCLLTILYLIIIDICLYFIHFYINKYNYKSNYYINNSKMVIDYIIISLLWLIDYKLVLLILTIVITRLVIDIPCILSNDEIKYGYRTMIHNFGFIFNFIDQFYGTYHTASDLDMNGFTGPFGWLISQYYLITLGPIEFSQWLDKTFNYNNKRNPLRIAWGNGWGVRLRSAEDVAEVIGTNAIKNGLSPHPGTVDLIAKALPAMRLALTDAWIPVRSRITSITHGATVKYTDLFAKSIKQRLLLHWTELAKDGKDVNIIDELTPLVSEIAFEHFLGLSDVPNSVHHALKDVFGDVRDKVLNPLWLIVGGRPVYRSQRRLVTDFIKTAIDKGLRQDSLGYAAVQARGKDDAVEEILALAVASTENTIILIAWTLYELARQPQLQQKIAEGDVDNILLKNCILESLRLYPPAYIVVESVINKVKLPSNYTIPAGSAVILPVLDLQRDPQYWKDEADSFKPQRWIDHQGPALSVFGGGSHQCPGRSLTQFEARHVVYAIIKHFNITIVNNNKPKFDPGLTLRPAQPLILKLANRI